MASKQNACDIRRCQNMAIHRYRVEYSENPFYDEAQALTVSCEVENEVQVVTTNATAIPEVQLVHLKMEDDFSTEYPGSTVYEIQASVVFVFVLSSGRWEQIKA